MYRPLSTNTLTVALDYVRMTLEDIQEAWEQHTKTKDANEDVPPALDGDCNDGVANNAGLCLPSFLKAFEELAKAKYLYSPHGGKGRVSVSHLLLRDVFDNITTNSSHVSAI